MTDDRPEPLKGSQKPKKALSAKLLEDDEVERLLSEADEDDDAEEGK